MSDPTIKDAADGLAEGVEEMLAALDGRRNLGRDINRCRQLLRTRRAAYLQATEGLDDDAVDP